MNKELSRYARDYLHKNLIKLKDSNIHVFKLLYSHENMSASLTEVIDSIPDSQLDLAMQQVENTIKKNAHFSD